MTRRQELNIIIMALVYQLSELYNKIKLSTTEDFISNYGKSKELQLQLDNYIKELKALVFDK